MTQKELKQMISVLQCVHARAEKIHIPYMGRSTRHMELYITLKPPAGGLPDEFTYKFKIIHWWENKKDGKPKKK